MRPRPRHVRLPRAAADPAPRPATICYLALEINKIIDMTLKYYDQLAILAYRISDNVIMRHADEVDSKKK